VNGLAESLRTVLASEQTARTMGAASLRIIGQFTFEQNVSGLRQALHEVTPGFQLTPAG
jgi:hypothetical protein